MPLCFFATDLHGRPERYRKLFDAILREGPDAVFLGGDLLPNGFQVDPTVPDASEFFLEFLAEHLERLRGFMKQAYPQVFLILGNDDIRSTEPDVMEGERRALWQGAHGRRLPFDRYAVYGYSCVPPTPFALKDWERYDVSRFVDPGSTSPEEGFRSVEVSDDEIRYSTMTKDLDRLAGDDDLADAIFLFHCPPYDTPLDLAALEGVMVEHVPLDPHVGSIAIRRFLEARGPRISLHGHVHEAPRLTGVWRTQVGRTLAFSAAHDGPELALVRFDPEDPERATRELI